jgi:hypoxanthine phosphoribosyltransferase
MRNEKTGMRIKDRDFVPFMGADEIATIVDGLAGRINEDYAGCGDLIVCPVLTGAFVFAADLVRGIKVPCRIEMVRYKSYSGMRSTGEVRCELPFGKDLEGKDVLIVEDVVDSGLSMQKMLEEVRELRPRSVRVCAMFFKPQSFKGDYKVDYVGREIGEEFIVGYGMDYDEMGRNLAEVMVVNEE